MGNKIKRENVVQFVSSTRLEWMGHVWRTDKKLMKRITSQEMKGIRPRERPRRRWMDSVREIMMEFTQLRTTNWNIPKDREKWKNLVSTDKSLNGL